MNLKTSKWDTCAGEGIILGMGGYSSDPSLNLINYSYDSETSNPNGFFSTTSKATFESFIKIVELLSKDD